MSKISVHFDNPSKTYYPGQAISGSVHIENKNPLSARGISVTANGYCKVHWTEDPGKHERHYSSKEEYYKLESMVWGNGSSSSDLPTGSNTFTFNFVLPHNIPATVEEKHGKVVHEIKANIDIPWWIDKKSIVPYIVQTALDLNKDPKAKVPIRVNNEKYVCCLCCKSGPISAILRIDRSGYIPGEKILINAKCTNMTERTVKSSAKLVKVTTFKSFKREIRHHQTVSEEIKHPAIKSGDTDFWQAQALTIPDNLEPSYLEHCGIMDINYNLVLELNISKGAKNLCVESEIVIGTHLLEGTENYNSGEPQSVILNPHLLPNTGYGYNNNTNFYVPVTAPPTSSSQLPVVESQYGLGAQSQYGLGAQSQYGMGTESSNSSAFTWR